MRIISFCAICLFSSLNTYEVDWVGRAVSRTRFLSSRFSAGASYGEKIFCTLSRAYHSSSEQRPAEHGAGRSSPAWRYTPVQKLSQPPDFNGHTPRKLPACAAISRIIADCAPNRRLTIIIHQFSKVKCFSPESAYFSSSGQKAAGPAFAGPAESAFQLRSGTAPG